MTQRERLLTLSAVECCRCDHPLSIQELNEFQSVADEVLHGGVYCRDCMETELLLCRECSCRYTADGLCQECAGRIYKKIG